MPRAANSRPNSRVRTKRLPDGTIVRVTVYDSRKRGKRSTPGKGKRHG